MEQQIISITNPKISLNILNQKDVESIHNATIEVLESIGVKFPSKIALKILKMNGCKVDEDTGIVKFPADTVERYIAQAPSSYTLAARDPDLDLPLDGNHSYLGTDGCGVEIVDAFTGERRTTSKKDVRDVARVADFLDSIAFHWVPISAQDYPPETRSLHELAAIWQVSRKHVQTESIVNAPEMKAAIEMATILSGSAEELRKRPILSIMQCTISPLAHDGGSLEAGLIAAEAGLPVGFMTMASCGSTGPVTMAGNMIVGNAEVLSALVLLQMNSPGCPVFYAAAQTAADLRTGAYTGGGPEDYIYGAATNLLSDFYNLPLSMGAFATGAKEPDWQAAVDNSFSSFMAVSTLSDMLLGAGLLHGSRIFSYEMLLMDSEIWSILHATFKGIEVNQETLALNVIREVGPGGNFLGHLHTRDHMRKRWIPELIDRRPYEIWEQKRDGARERAREKAQNILNDYHPEALDTKLDDELHKIIADLEVK